MRLVRCDLPHILLFLLGLVIVYFNFEMEIVALLLGKKISSADG